MKQITIRLDDQVVSRYSDYKNITSAVTQAAESFYVLRRYTLEELKGRFSHAEIVGLCDMFNGTIIQPEMSVKSVLLAQLEDAENFDNLSARHGFKYSELKEKIEGLTASQVFFLIHEIDRFWNDPVAYGSPTPEMKKLLKTF